MCILKCVAGLHRDRLKLQTQFPVSNIEGVVIHPPWSRDCSGFSGPHCPEGLLTPAAVSRSVVIAAAAGAA